MRRAALTTVLATFLAVAATAQVRVTIASPAAGQFAFGQVNFIAQVESVEPVAKVVFEVDGRTLEVLERPPWAVKVDLGQENVTHRFRVTAQTAAGATGEAVVSTPAIQVDEQVDVDLQQLFVTVTEGDRRVLDLQRGQFSIHEDGREQQLVTFERGDVPLTAVLLLDSSESMRLPLR